MSVLVNERVCVISHDPTADCPICVGLVRMGEHPVLTHSALCVWSNQSVHHEFVLDQSNDVGQLIAVILDILWSMVDQSHC